jgi:ATP-dependent Clp protease ATP-binding subunit ClpA
MKTKVTYGKEVVDHFASRAFDPSLGARNVRQAIENDVTVKLSRVALAALSESRQPEEIRIVLGADGVVGVEEVREAAAAGAS